jgi:toxin ParE1/3/4
VTVLWTRLAVHDLDAAYEYIAQSSPGAAQKTVEKIEAAVAGLARHPRIGRAGRVSGTRELVVAGSPFIIAYRTAANVIEILAVMHGARMWPDRF